LRFVAFAFGFAFAFFIAFFIASPSVAYRLHLRCASASRTTRRPLPSPLPCGRWKTLEGIKPRRCAVEASQIERVRRLRIIQIDDGAAVARNCLEAIRIAVGEDRHESRKGLRITSPKSLWGKVFAKLARLSE
jgi:hypothetical protein